VQRLGWCDLGEANNTFGCWNSDGQSILMSYAIARRRGTNGELNKLYPGDEVVHGWYRFVLSFPPHLVRDYIQQFGLTSNHRVPDPFCGTGTTLVESK
jgi:hypothetical protein